MMYRANTQYWYLERITWLLAGCMSLLSALLAWLVSPWWLILAALVGVNLIVFALSGYCVMAGVLHAFGVCSLAEKCPDK